MARRTRQQALVTRQNILDAATLVFLEKGFQHSSMQDVADRAGVTRGAVYWHFCDRGDLLEALLDATQLPWQVLDPLQKPMLLGGSPAVAGRPALVQLGLAPMLCLEASVPAQQLLRILEQVSAQDGIARLDADRCAALQCMQAALAQAAAHGTLRPEVDPGAAALGLFSLVDGLMHQWLRQPAAFGLAAVGGQVVQTHLAGLLVP